MKFLLIEKDSKQKKFNSIELIDKNFFFVGEYREVGLVSQEKMRRCVSLMKMSPL
jgi:hypothetical protein